MRANPSVTLVKEISSSPGAWSESHVSGATFCATDDAPPATISHHRRAAVHIEGGGEDSLRFMQTSSTFREGRKGVGRRGTNIGS